jgi:DNA-binding PadR family transcriptional regulator
MAAFPEKVRKLLPLRPAPFHILLALAEEERHGYALKKDVELRTNGIVKLGPGTLYESIQRMVEKELIAESPSRPRPEDDQAQRRYYRITKFGKNVLRAEVARLGEVIDDARIVLEGAGGA